MLAIRADADARIGLGHAMRCFALAEAWCARGGQAVFFSGAELPGPVLARLDGAGIAHQVLADSDNGGRFAEAAAGISARWLVVDGSFATPEYLDRVQGVGLPNLVIDDAASDENYPCDLLLNQNVQATVEAYAGRTEAKVLAGPGFALIRADMRESIQPRTIPDRPRRILVLVGGADPGGHLEALAEAAVTALRQEGIDDGRVDAVIGPASAWRPPADTDPMITYHRDVKDMGVLIAGADLAISSAGSTVWELSLHGTPMILGASVPVEEPVGAGMAAKGAALYLGRLSECPAQQLVAEIVRLLQGSTARRKLSAAASALVDGRGAERVIGAMLGIEAGTGIS
jgi:UDP-2,4-diacetamido-2,4,6-trideoxy-beta-L-altropyranose hydrolase